MTFHWRPYLLGIVAYMAALLFGYDTGVAGGVIALPSFQKDFGLVHEGAEQTPHERHRTADLSANIVSVLQAGAFFGALAVPLVSERFGRRIGVAIYAIVFIIGGIIQTVANGSLGAIYAGRVIGGIGVGGASGLAPTYVSECAPKKNRGRIAGLFQVMVTLGVALSYWVTYGCKLHLQGNTQWRVPLAVQIIPGGLLLIGLFFMKESPRWLARKERNDEAVANLAYLRHSDTTDIAILEEFAEIRAGIDQELKESDGVSWREALLPGNRNRFFFAFMAMTLQQWGGQNIVNYYAPTIFASVGISSNNTSLFASGVYGLVKVAATALFLMIGVEQFGRKLSFGFGGLAMGILFYIVGAIGKTHTPDPDADSVSSASIGMVAMIYLFAIAYSFSWGPLPWVYASEIFPNRLRAFGVGFAAATQWLMNFALSRTAPEAEVNLGFNLFIVFGSVNIFNGLFGFLFPETRGLSLEAMDELFGFVSKESREKAIKDVENAMHIGEEQDMGRTQSVTSDLSSKEHFDGQHKETA